MIEELLDPTELEKLLRDSYANYVIQTAVSLSSQHYQCTPLISVHSLTMLLMTCACVSSRAFAQFYHRSARLRTVVGSKARSRNARAVSVLPQAIRLLTISPPPSRLRWQLPSADNCRLVPFSKVHQCTQPLPIHMAQTSHHLNPTA